MKIFSDQTNPSLQQAALEEERKSPPLSELLRRALSSQLTGYLELREAAVRRRITFIDGMPVFVRSNLLREHLLHFRLEKGHLDQSLYTSFLERVQDGRWHRGETLVRSGVLSEEVLKAVRVNLAESILSTCFGWRNVTYHFQPMTRKRLSGRPVLSLDVFSLYEAWLSAHVSHWRLRRQIERFEGRVIGWSQTGQNFQSHVKPLLARYSTLAQAARGGCSVQAFFDSSQDAQEPLACALLSLFHLGALTLRRREDSFSLDGQFSVTHVANPEPNFSASLDEDYSGDDEVMEVTRAELRRIEKARSPYAILGLEDGARPEEVQRAHERFEAYYRAADLSSRDNEQLLEMSGRLLEYLRQARQDILHGDEVGLDTANTWMGLAEPQEDIPHAEHEEENHTAVSLASIFFEDGRAYLRLGDYVEAQRHFAQSRKRHDAVPRYLAYLGWSTFLCAGEDLEERASGQEMLRESIALDPLLDEAFVLLGHVYCRSSRFERGMEMYKRALELNPQNEEAMQALQPLE